MNTHFPISEKISRDIEPIINALTARSREIKRTIESQSLFKRISIISLKTFGLAASMIAAASAPLTLITFSAAPLTIATIFVAAAVTCLALCMLLDAKSPGEAIVKEHWKALFEAIRNGTGPEIITTCKELAKQKDSRPSSFIRCLGALSSHEITPFFHKTCLIGYLLIAIDSLINNKDSLAHENAQLALSHFDASGFSYEVKNFIKIVLETPQEIRSIVNIYFIQNKLHALDFLLVMSLKGIIPKS